MSTPIAIVQFVTLPNGAFRYMRGLTRGYYRVDVIDPSLRRSSGIVRTNAKAHLATIYTGAEGLHGVTDRSKYSLRSSRARAKRIAHEWNVSLGC